MFVVEVYTAVRQFVFNDGKSRREAARVFGLSRETVSKMWRFSMPPGYVRQPHEQTATNTNERDEKRRSFKGRAISHNVRDEGVAGSNPATPTIYLIDIALFFTRF